MSKIPIFFWPYTFIIFAVGCNETTDEPLDTPDSSISIDSLFEAYHRDQLNFNPFLATHEGKREYNDTMPNILSDQYRADLLTHYSKYLEALKAFDPDSLTESRQLSKELLEYELSLRQEGLKLPLSIVTSPIFNFPMFVSMPINQFLSMHLYMGQLAGGGNIQPFDNAKDYDNWLSRVDDYMIFLDTAIVKMKNGMEKGIVLPKIIIERVVAQLDNFIDTPVDDHPFYIPVKNMPDRIGGEERTRIDQAYKSMIAEKLIPQYSKLREFMSGPYMEEGTDASGIGALPQGDEVYKYLVRLHTSTNLTPEEIFEIGKSEVARIMEEMKSIKKEVGFEGDMKAFFNHVRTNEKLMPYNDPQQVIDHFNAIHEKMKPRLKELFDLTPKAGFVVKRTEAFREKTASAEYNPGSKDGTRPGIFYVPVPDAEAYNNYADESLFLHEAIPGHHYQLSLQQENEDLPEFMRAEGMPAFVEGWALYCESLGKELGLYEDPYQYFGMLSAEMHRAIRLVVDVGMHAKGWTREEAIQYSLDHEAEPEASIIAEIERYMVMPGQALAYKIGQLKILELRKYAEESLGDRFEIREFHNQVLNSGSLSLKLLEEKIMNWVESYE